MKVLHRLALGAACLALLVALAPAALASPMSRPMADGALSGCTGEYFNNTTLAGSASVVRSDPSLYFFWPEGTSPAPGININNYSVRWTCTLNVGSSGNVTFTMRTDDGMNLLVDGNLIVWAWYDQGPSTYTGTVNLSAGAHTVRVEYYNHTLGGTAQVTSSAIAASYPDWKGEYYNNQSLSGGPTVTRDDTAINFDWGAGSPDPSIPFDHFSVRWTRTLYFGAGTWRFTTTTDDGTRLWVDGNLLIDRWYDQPATSYSSDIALAAGNHSVRMEYYDDTLYAVAKLSYWSVSATPTGAWQGQYFNNVSLSGAPVLVRSDSAVNFNWGTGSPGAGVPADYFSAKWDSVQTLATTGNYTVMATSDDGVRVWLDGVLLIDAWYDHAPTTFSAVRWFGAGPHNVHVEYYERTVGAMINVQIVPGSGTTPPPPPPPPGGEVIVDDWSAGWRAGGSSSGWRGTSAGIGGHAFWTYNHTYVVAYYNWARWYPALPAARYYEVFAYIPGGIATTTNARYWVYHAGRYNLAARGQGFYANQWVSLGTYYFNAAGGEYVSLADVTYECYLCRTLVFDAVKFSPR